MSTTPTRPGVVTIPTTKKSSTAPTPGVDRPSSMTCGLCGGAVSDAVVMPPRNGRGYRRRCIKCGAYTEGIMDFEVVEVETTEPAITVRRLTGAVETVGPIQTRAFEIRRCSTGLVVQTAATVGEAVAYVRGFLGLAERNA